MQLSWYERHVLPYVLDLACGQKPIAEQRAKLIPGAHGRVLEIGIGTGLNLPFYDQSRIHSLVGVDPAVQMHRLARKRLVAAGIDAELVGLSAEKLPLDSSSFDTVVCTYTLCSIPDPHSALTEMRRVLKPGGKLLFSEHGRAPDANVRRWQDRLQPLWGRIAGGCQLGRDIPSLLSAAGFDLQIESGYLPGPRFAAYSYWGEATVAGR
jgi:ubiquinone/menaquinone biosynthesis C-methylase UbiE